VLLRGYRGAGMGDTGRRVAGRLDDDLDLGIGTGVAAIRDEPRARELRLVPADGTARLAGTLKVKVGMTAISTPGIVGAWFRNIEPNLPAPISPTRTGRPAAARLCASW